MSTTVLADRARVIDALPQWRLLDDVQILELPDPDFLIAGVIPRRSVGVVYSPPGVGKTTFVGGMSVCIATGRPWFGHEIRHRGAVVYVGAEDPSGFKVRLRAAKVAERLPLDEPLGVFTFPEALDIRDSAAVQRFGRFLEQSFDSSDFVREMLILDTFAAVTPGASENSSEDMSVAMGHAQQLRDRLGLTVLVVHHTNAGGSRERGHSAMRGCADFMISLTPIDDQVVVECSKQRNAAPFASITVKLVPVEGGGCIFRSASDVLPAVSLTPIQAKVFAVLRDTFAADGATKGEWQRTCSDVSERSFHRACKVLVETGYVRASGSKFTVVSGKEPL